MSAYTDKELDKIFKKYTSVIGLDNGGDGEPDLWSISDWNGFKKALKQELKQSLEAQKQVFCKIHDTNTTKYIEDVEAVPMEVINKVFQDKGGNREC